MKWGDAETDWDSKRKDVLETFTPGTPIDEADLFAGRKDTIQKLQDIVIERGRHAIIYGERGVGKTSIANIFYKPLHSTTRPILPIRVAGVRKDSFDSLWRKVFRRIKRTYDGETLWADEGHKDEITPDDVQIELSDFGPNDNPVVIIDEYDRIEDEKCKIWMTDTIKSISDSPVNCTIILVGVADSVTELVYDHASIAGRALIQVPMVRMSQNELADIAITRVRRLGMTIGDDAVWRATYFSAGLPFYTHSLGKHAALHAVMKRRLKITEQDVLDALTDCMGDVDYTIQENYVRATERIYRKPNIFPQVLAACALAEPNTLGQFTAAAVEETLSAIMKQPYKTPSFAFHLNEMCGPDRGSILRKSGERRTYRYRFAEPVMQPYVIMKSLSAGLIGDDLLERFSINRQRKLSI